MKRPTQARDQGFTLIELLMTLTIGSALVLGVSDVMSRTLQAREVAQAQNEMTREVRFAMQQMVQSVSHTRRVLLPLMDDRSTTLKESVREQSFAPSPPPESNSIPSAILAVTLSPLADRDGDGVMDADNDGDGLIDEDVPSDSNNDGAPGLAGIDDRHGNRDGGPGADSNGDSCPGICLVDDNGDGIVDNGLFDDDDEDGESGEDWYDSVVFYLSSDNLIQRTPVPWDINSSGHVSGDDYVEEVIARHVRHFRIERIAQSGAAAEVMAITLKLASPDAGTEVSLSTRVRVGSRL